MPTPIEVGDRFKLTGHTSTRMVETVYARLGVGIQADAIGRLPVSEEE